MPPKNTKRPGYWKTIESRDADADVLVGIARCCHDDFDDLAAAKAALARALELEPTNHSAHELLADILEAEGDADGAMALLQAYVQHTPPLPLRSSTLGQMSAIQERQSDWRGVVETLELVRLLGYDDERLGLSGEDWCRLGNAYLIMGEFPQAIATMQEALAWGEETAQFILGLALHARGEWEAAEEAYEACTDLGQPYWAYASLARLYCDQGDFKLAAQRVVSTLGFDRLPGDMPVAIVEGDLLRCCDGDLAGARAKYEQAIAEEADPELVALAHAGLGFVALAEGDAARALELFELAKSFDEHEPAVVLGLGQALAATGDEAGARASLEHALELRPGWAEAQAAVEALGSSAGAGADERPAKRSRRRR